MTCIYLSTVGAQNTGEIVELSEEVVEPAGGTGVLNCSVYYSTEDARNNIRVSICLLTVHVYINISVYLQYIYI